VSDEPLRCPHTPPCPGEDRVFISVRREGALFVARLLDTNKVDVATLATIACQLVADDAALKEWTHDLTARWFGYVQRRDPNAHTFQARVVEEHGRKQ